MLKIDLHIHTVASGHAQNTLLEYINQSEKLKMDTIGISDHGPKTDSLATEAYFNTLKRIPERIGNIRVLKGVETNIIATEGKLDVSSQTLERLDYVMAGFHPTSLYENQGEDGNTQAMINVIKQGKVDILAHPFVTDIFPMDVEKISQEACKNNILLEVNLSYVKKFIENEEIMSNLKTIIKVAKENNKKVILGSDAHNIWELADDSVLKGVQEKIGLTEDLIINNYPEELFEFLNIEE